MQVGDDDWFFPRGRSKVWTHYMKNRNRKEVMCSLCGRLFGTSTASIQNTTILWRHLVLKHKIKTDYRIYWCRMGMTTGSFREEDPRCGGISWRIGIGKKSCAVSARPYTTMLLMQPQLCWSIYLCSIKSRPNKDELDNLIIRSDDWFFPRLLMN